MIPTVYMSDSLPILDKSGKAAISPKCCCSKTTLRIVAIFRDGTSCCEDDSTELDELDEFVIPVRFRGGTIIAIRFVKTATEPGPCGHTITYESDFLPTCDRCGDFSVVLPSELVECETMRAETQKMLVLKKRYWLDGWNAEDLEIEVEGWFFNLLYDENNHLVDLHFSDIQREWESPVEGMRVQDECNAPTPRQQTKTDGMIDDFIASLVALSREDFEYWATVVGRLNQNYVQAAYDYLHGEFTREKVHLMYCDWTKGEEGRYGLASLVFEVYDETLVKKDEDKQICSEDAAEMLEPLYNAYGSGGGLGRASGFVRDERSDGCEIYTLFLEAFCTFVLAGDAVSFPCRCMDPAAQGSIEALNEWLGVDTEKGEVLIVAGTTVSNHGHGVMTDNAEQKTGVYGNFMVPVVLNPNGGYHYEVRHCNAITDYVIATNLKLGVARLTGNQACFGPEYQFDRWIDASVEELQEQAYAFAPFVSADVRIDAGIPLCDDVGMSLTLTRNGTDYTIELFFDNYEMAFVGKGLLPCDAGTTGDAWSFSFDDGGGSIFSSGPDVDSITCSSGGGMIVSGHAYPYNAGFDVCVSFDFSEAQQLDCINPLYPPMGQVAAGSPYSSESMPVPIPSSGCLKVCGPNPLLPNNGFWDVVAALVVSHNGSQSGLSCVDRFATVTRNDWSYSYDSTTATLNAVLHFHCEGASAVRVKLNGATVTNPGSGLVANGYYIVNADDGTPLTQPTFSAPTGSCFTPRFKWGWTFPAVMNGSTEGEIEWTANVNVVVASQNGEWPSGSGESCPATPSQYPSCESYDTYPAPSDDSIFAKAKNRSIPGTVNGASVSFSYNQSTESWEYSGSVVIAEITPSTIVPWTFAGGTFGTAGNDHALWAASAPLKAFFNGCADSSKPNWWCYIGAETVTITDTVGALSSCSSGTLTDTDTAIVDLSPVRVLTEYSTT